MTSISACFKIHSTSKELQASIRKVIQNHRDSGSNNPALDAINYMIAVDEASRSHIADRIEAAGGDVPTLKLYSGENTGTVQKEIPNRNNEVNDGTLATGQTERTPADDRNGAAGDVTESLPSDKERGEGTSGVPVPDGKSPDGRVSAGSSADGRRGKQGKPATVEAGTGNNDADQGNMGNSPGESPGVSGKPVSSRARDYRIPAGGIKREGSWKATAKRNLDIIELAQKLEAEGRQATMDEQELLAKYTGFGATEIANNLFPGYARTGEIQPGWSRDEGWGKLAARMKALLTKDEIKTAARSTQYAHYTSEAIINSIYNALDRFGFKGGKVLEPGAGVSSFWGLMPDAMYKKSRYTGIEMDHVTALIAKHLYPKQAVLRADFTQQKLPGNFFDLAIGNPPFSDTKITSDPEYKKNKFLLHDYFFAKSVDKVRPGGLLVFVTSKGTMDKAGDKARQYLAERADLLGAIRLPQTAFKQHSGTEVVTDVLFLRKREEGQAAAGEAWMGRGEVTTDEGPTLINEYFASHPEMVLGKNSLQGSMYGANEYTVIPHEGDIEEHFAEAVKNLPKSVYSAPKATKKEKKLTEQPEDVVEFEFNPDNKKEGGIYLNKGGKLMRVQNGAGKTVTPLDGLTEKQISWLKDYVPLRDAVKKAQFDQLNDGDWEKSLKALNKEYDAFVKKHGPILDNTTTERVTKNDDGEDTVTITKRYKNKKVMSFDVESPAVRALEKEDDQGNVTKGSFLTGRSIQKPERKKPETIADALALSLDTHGTLDVDDIAESLGITEQEAIDGLGDLIYKNPDSGAWETRDEYLSGNVKEKLEMAKTAAESDEQYKRNVEALEEAQPSPLKAADVTIKLGAPWIEPETIVQFAREVLNVGVSIEYSNPTNYFSVKPTGRDTVQGGRGEAAEWGTQKRSPIELLDSVLNNRTIKVTESDGKKTVADVTGTVAANEIADRMRQRFSSWVWEDADRAGKLLDEYNSRYNNLAGRKFDGSHLTLPGVSLKFNLHPHQKNAIWRIIQTGNAYIGHAVGAGKTMVMIAAGMEMKRLGLVQKPIYVVPKHMLNQFSNEFLELYPMANVMVADEENFHTDNRRNFIAQAALNSPDAIIITHPSLKKLGMQQENIDVVADQMIADLRDALQEMEEDDKSGNRFLIKRVEKRIEKMEQMFAGMISSDRDQAMTFEELGVDFMFVDEAHEFRKLDFATNRQAKGIDSNGSQQAIDLFIKTKWLGTQNHGRSHVFASGTPVTNTMGELYNLMRFFIEDEMDADGIRHFDAWASMFGEVAPDFERNAAGTYQIVERFAKFVNVPELMKRVRSFMDVLTFTDLGAFVKRPEVNGGMPKMVVSPQSKELSDYLKGPLTKRLEASAKWKPSKEQPGNPDPVINIITDGRLASIDMRFIDPRLPSNPDSKLNTMIDGIIKTWKETKDLEYTDRITGEPHKEKGGTQIVFFNLGFGEGVKQRGFDARAWATKRLREAGIPASQIGWMEDANTAVKKKRLFAEMNSGTKRILIGSAKQMGTGVNVQQRLHSLHYLDSPWYPADVEQPMGRIIRQGNQNDEIHAFWYATEGSYDSTMWQMVARKSKFTEQAFSGDDSVRTLEDISTSSQYEMATAISSGDSRVIQLAGLKNEIERLSRLKTAHNDNQRTMARNRRERESNIKYSKRELKHLEEAAEKVGGYIRDWDGDVDGKTFEKRAEFGAAIQAKMEAVVDPDRQYRGGVEVKDVGKINGYKLVAEITAFGTSLKLVVTKNVKITIADNGDPGGLVTRLVNALNGVHSKKRDVERDIENFQDEIAKYDKKIGAPFEHGAELNAKIAEAQQLESELLAEGNKDDTHKPPSDEILISIDEGSRIEDGRPQRHATVFARPVSSNRVARSKVNLSMESETLPEGHAADVAGEIRAAGAEALVESGDVQIISPAEAADIAAKDNAQVRYAKDGRIQGIVSGGKVYLVQGGIRRGEAWNILVHEAGVHAGQALHNDKEFQSILKMMADRRGEKSKTGEAIREAFSRVPRSTKREHITEEALAYLVQAHPETTMVRRIVAIVKRLLVKLGMPVNIYNAADLRALAETAVRVKVIEAQNKNLAKGAGNGIIEGNQQLSKGANNDSKYSIDGGGVPVGASIPRTHSGTRPVLSESERRAKRTELVEAGFYESFPSNGSRGSGGLLQGPDAGETVHPTSTGRRNPSPQERVANFKQWFGKSLAEIDGVPMVFYQSSETFGSGGPETWEFNDKFLGKNKRAPRAGLGPTFTMLQGQAGFFPGKMRAFHLRLENPLILDDAVTKKWKSIDDAIAFANRQENLNGYDSIFIPEAGFVYTFDPNQAKLIDNSGEYGLETNDTRYSKDAGTGFTEEELNDLLADQGSITYLKNKKTDSTFLDRVFSTPEYYFKKFAAGGRVLQAALARRDLRYTTEQKILGGFVQYIQDLRKKNKAAYKEANDYLLSIDREHDGFKVKPSKNGEQWRVIAPMWAIKEGEDKIVGTFPDEETAINAMIRFEGMVLSMQGYSTPAVKAIRLARELTNEGFNIMAADMRKIIAEAADNGLPDPFVGDGQIDESGRYAIYAAGKKMPIALFATQEEAEKMLKQAAQMISYAVQSKKGGERSFKSEVAARKWAAKHSGTVKGKPMFANLVIRQRKDSEMRPLTVKQALAQMGDLRGSYFPRIREAGEYIMIARKDGENPIRKHFDIPTVGDDKPTLQKVLAWTTPIGREAQKLKEQGYTITIKKDDSPGEDVFEATNLVSSLDAILQDSMRVIDKNSDSQVKAGQHINQILTMQIADIFKARGYLSSRIRRLDGDDVWEGYEEDMGKALTQYAQNVAAGTAKRETAKAMILAFTGRDYSWADYKREVEDPDWSEYKEIVEKRRIDPGKQKNLFRDVRSFMVDVLRNQEQADRIMGTMKGLAVLKYLGFRVSSAAINMTNMVQGVPATLAGHTGESLHTSLGRVISAATAYGKYRAKKGLSAEDRAIFEHISAMGWDEAQFNYEAAKELRSKTGEAWNKFMTGAMFMFGAAEKANRAMTLFAAYKAVRETEKTAEESVVWEKAKEISDRAHGIYGKETLPAWARGKYNILRLTYTFQKFSHNYMLNMIDLGFTRKEYKAAAYMLLSPALLAGAGASLAGPALFAMAGALGIGGDDPEEKYYDEMERLFGAGTFARHGIFGTVGLNLKGSLSMSLPMPVDVQNAKVTDLMGPVGGIVADVMKGAGHLGKGDIAKGIEFLLPTAFGSMSKATREAGEGVTTSNYGTIWYGDEPLKADTMDAFLRFLSFNPARLSGIREKQWNEKKVAARFQEEKTAIYSQIKRDSINGSGLTPEILKAIKAYNDRVLRTDVPGANLSPITLKRVRAMLKRNGKPSKVEKMRAA